MSYRIEYDGRIGKFEVLKDRTRFLPEIAMAATVLLAVFLLHGHEGFRDFLIPGEKAVTTAAFHAMTDDLRSGAGLWEAFSDFCGTVIRES